MVLFATGYLFAMTRFEMKSFVDPNFEED